MPQAPWWETAVIYQIYPRSFQDSDGDGVGDLPGMLRRLDHLEWLGVDAVWLSPIFPSPMADFGYDVCDHAAIHPMFGTMADFDALLDALHARGIRLLLDFVPNHTSEAHPWFIESRASRDSPKRDWYIWRDPAPDGGPPNNWHSVFGGGAWEWDAVTGQYYHHAFLKEQPDLNWRNPQVRRAMYDVMRFWLDKGVDGFRVDVLWHLIKDEHFRDNPPNPAWTPDQPPHLSTLPVYSADRPEVHEVVAEMRALCDSYGDRLLIGEIYLPIERLVAYYGADLRGAHLPFNFQLLLSAWNAAGIAKVIEDYEAALPEGGWPNWVLSNHDRPRIAARVGVAQARVAAMLLLTLRGTPTLYYGDELGLAAEPVPPECVRDPLEHRLPGLGLGRDPSRTPMPWDDSPNAGFTTGHPWLPLNPDWPRVNVARERENEVSLLNLHRRLIALRRTEPALRRGSYRTLAQDGDLLAYLRLRDRHRLLVVLNMGPEPEVMMVEGVPLAGRVLLSTHLDREGERVEGDVVLRGDEGVIVALD